MKKRVWTIGCILCALVLGCCGGYIFWYLHSEKENGAIYDQLKEEAAVTPEAEKDSLQASVTSVPQEIQEEIPIDFDALKAVNPDIYAWIRIEGTNIDYPVVQSTEDDAYYLNHTIEGNAGYPGSIYSEMWNSQDFSDFNTVLYGHNMKDGSMFQNLHNYEDILYMEEHAEVSVYTPEHVYRYEIFAAVNYSDVHLANAFDYATAQGRQAFLDSVRSARSMSDIVRTDVPVNADDKILTLSTCIGSQPDRRLLVEAVLKDE